MKKKKENIKRLEEILLILFENGFGYIIDKIGLKRLIPIKKRFKPRFKILKSEQRLRITLEKLGPTFIKFGQLLSLRPDLLPPGYIRELSKLQDKVPPIKFDEVKAVIEKELKKPLEKIFSSFDKVPFASASISQVHKAKLGDKLVAVKVQRPNVDKIMAEDISIMYHLAGILEKKSEKIAKLEPKKVIHELSLWTKKELDFKNEARNANRVRQNFRDNSKIVIPKVYDKYSTKKILTLDYIDGIELKDINRLKKTGHDIKKILKVGFDAILTQVFIHGFFHADPHPGNIILTQDGKIALVDFGIFGQFDEKLRKSCIRIFEGIITNDVEEVMSSFLDISSTKRINEKAFKEDIEAIIKPLKGSAIKDIKVSSILEDALLIGSKYRLKMPLSFILFGKTIATLEGIALKYDPTFKIVESSEPFIEKLIKKEFNLRFMTKDFIKSLTKFKRFITDLPEQTTKALKTVQEGKVKLDMKNTDIKGLSVEIDKSSNRLAYGMVIAALIVSGALTVNVNMPTIFDLPLISVLCFVFAGILGLLLLKSILAEKRIER